MDQLAAPTLSILRKRRYRRRIAAGETVIALTIGPDALEELVRLGYLAPALADDREAVQRATARALVEALGG